MAKVRGFFFLLLHFSVLSLVFWPFLLGYDICRAILPAYCAVLVSYCSVFPFCCSVLSFFGLIFRSAAVFWFFLCLFCGFAVWFCFFLRCFGVLLCCLGDSPCCFVGFGLVAVWLDGYGPYPAGRYFLMDTHGNASLQSDLLGWIYVMHRYIF